MRIIGLDIHRAFAEAVAWEYTEGSGGWVVSTYGAICWIPFAAKLSLDDVGVIEATGNASSAAAIVAPHVKKVVIANPKQVRIIAYAKIKTDTIDASVLAQLYGRHRLGASSPFNSWTWNPCEHPELLTTGIAARDRD